MDSALANRKQVWIIELKAGIFVLHVESFDRIYIKESPEKAFVKTLNIHLNVQRYSFYFCYYLYNNFELLYAFLLGFLLTCFISHYKQHKYIFCVFSELVYIVLPVLESRAKFIFNNNIQRTFFRSERILTEFNDASFEVKKT